MNAHCVVILNLNVCNYYTFVTGEKGEKGNLQPTVKGEKGEAGRLVHIGAVYLINVDFCVNCNHCNCF